MAHEKNEIRALYDNADREWTGVNWYQPFVAEHGDLRYEVVAADDLDLAEEEHAADVEFVVEQLPEGFLRALHDAFDRAVKYTEEVTEAATSAQDAGDRAIWLYEQGQIVEAAEAAREAAELEREFGDAPVWGPLASALADLADALDD
jgi:hypothetical protein